MHPIQCKCGALRAQLEGTGTHNRVICYCTDCRAFARMFDNGTGVLDRQGGTEIVQVAQSRLRFVQGEEHLAAIRLSPRGMIRWYAACCATPLGNTLGSPKMAFIGLVHSCLDRGRMDKDFGHSVAVANTGTALGDPKPGRRGVIGLIARFIWLLAASRITGSYRKSPLFDAAGQPRAQPRLLSREEVARLKSAG